MASFVEKLTSVKVKQRLAFVYRHEAKLADLRGRLLCQASSHAARKRWPIFGERSLTDQEEFEVQVYADPIRDDIPGAFELRADIDPSDLGNGESDDDGN
jgi:hypothetical protein